MPEHASFVGGDWNAQCDVCGRVFKASQMGKCWDGSMRCTVGGMTGTGCWEQRHPQDFVRAVPDDQSTPWARDWNPTFPESLLASAILTLGVIAPSVTAGTGGRFPVTNGVTTGFLAILTDPNDPSVREIVGVATIAADTLAITDRGLRGSLARTWAVGSNIAAITGVVPYPFAV